MNAQNRPTNWKKAGYGIGGLLALVVLFLGVVMLSNLGLRGVRLDLTQNHLYTLSPGTKQVLGEIKEPVNLYFYFSREAAEKQSPLIMPYANRVREFLEEVVHRPHLLDELDLLDEVVEVELAGEDLLRVLFRLLLVDDALEVLHQADDVAEA